METRGRGREARATTDETPTSTTRASAARNNSSPAPFEPPSTRSRTRQRASTILPHTVSRNTRASAPASSAQAHLPPPPAAPVQPRPKRSSISRRSGGTTTVPFAASSLTSGRASTSQRPTNSTSTTSAPSTTRAPATRKRTRSSSRRHPGQVASSSLLPSAVEAPHLPTASALAAAASSAAVAAALSTRPWKRPRRSPPTGRHPRAIGGLSSPGRAVSGSAASRRHSRDMDPSNPAGNSNPRDVEAVVQMRDDDGPSSLGSDRAGANTLQGLLRRLGADLSDIFPTSGATSHARLQQLRTSINSPDSNEQQIDALSELCEFLSVGTEESLVSFSVNLFVGPLVNLLRTGNNIEIKIYAARALTHMMEALPSSSSTIANHGAAGPLCQNLLSIEYIDLAEQSLSALYKLSVDYPQQIVSANGFQAVLSFIDFFSLGVQRVAAATACNLCRLPRADAMDMVSGVLPTMMRLLDSEDQRIRESAILGFTRLAESFRSAHTKLEILCGEESILLDKVFGLIVPTSPPALAPHSYSSALRMLATLSRGSSKLGLQILRTESLILKLKLRLTSGATMHSVECLVLADSLLPEIPDTDGGQSPSSRSRRRRSVGTLAAFAAVDAKRREELQSDLAPLRFFGMTLFSTMMKFYISCADSNARRLALSIMAKFITIAPEDVLLDVITEKSAKDKSETTVTNAMQFCPFVAALLGANSSRNETLVGLAMADSALQKIPALREAFAREGVVHEIVRLAALGSNIDEGDGNDDVEIVGDNTDGPQVAATPGSPAETSARPSGVSSAEGSAARSMEPIWTVVAAFQRGSLQRGSRSDAGSGSQRLPGRPLDTRFSDPDSVQFLVPKAARSILRMHLGAQTDGNIDEKFLNNSILSCLTYICVLLDPAKASFEESKAVEGLRKLVDLLTAPQRLTVFEVSKSGLMEVLARYLTPETTELMDSRLFSLVECLNAGTHQRPFSALVDLALGVLASEEKLPIQIYEWPAGTASASVSSGLRQLAQPFKLRLRKASSEEGGANLRDYSHHVVLIEPLATMSSVQEFLWPKVRQPDRSASGSLPTSTRRRGAQTRGSSSARMPESDNRSEGRRSPRGGTRLSVDLDEDDYVDEGMFDMEDDNNEDEELADEEDDDDQNSDPSDGEVSSGEEDVIEQGGGESDENDVDAGDAFDVDQLGTSLPPFELDHDSLGQAPIRGNRFNTIGSERLGRAGSASQQANDATATFRSYAAALAANMPRRINRITATGSLSRNSQGPGQNNGDRDGAIDAQPQVVKRLSFTLNGRQMHKDCSILSAVIQSSAESRGIGPRLWSDIHTLVYSKAHENESDVDGDSRGVLQGSTSDADKAQDCAGGDASGPVRRSPRLLENRGKNHVPESSLPRDIETEVGSAVLAKVTVDSGVVPSSRLFSLSNFPDSITPVIDVLKQLNWIYEKLTCRYSRINGVRNNVHCLNEDSDVVFNSEKLKAKLLRQLSDPLALCGNVVPEWCFSISEDSSFLIPFEARRILFQSTALGVARGLHQLQTRVDNAGVSNATHRASRGHRDSEARVGRIQRQKVRLHRSRILESAITMMTNYSAHPTVLEVQYFDEAGTGLGPTLEFYTLASREIQRVDLGLWRSTGVSVPKEKKCVAEDSGSNSGPTGKSVGLGSRTAIVRRRSRRHSQSIDNSQMQDIIADDGESPSYVVPTGSGLFPSCLPIVSDGSEKETSAKTLFSFVGKLLGKAIVDGRLLDLRFSKTFSRLLLAYCGVLSNAQKRAVSKSNDGVILGRDSAGNGKVSACDWDQVTKEDVWDALTSGTTAMKLLEDVDPQLASSLKAVMQMVRTAEEDSFEALAMTFVLPGDDEMELIRGGKNIAVTSNNAEEFVRRVTYHVLFGGVQNQAEALLHGLNDVMGIKNLLCFQDHELEMVICGPSFEKWTIDFLVQATRCDHGYSHESPAVLYFLQILSEMNQEDQQRFVLFATGSPALPLGGLRSLHPKLTIVRRTPEAGRSPDECLPTVMTCTNYFKLPEYSSFVIAKKQTMYAVREGQGSFHLS